MEVKIVDDFESNGEPNIHIITGSMVGFAMLTLHARAYGHDDDKVEAFAKKVDHFKEGTKLCFNVSAIPDVLLRDEAQRANLEKELASALEVLDRNLVRCDTIVVDLRIYSGPLDAYIVQSMNAAVAKVSLTRVRTILLVQPTS